MSLDKIAEEVRTCTKCELYKTKINSVPGEGSVTAKIMICGEAPGSIESQTGRPFTGRSGLLLRRTLQQVGITPADVFISNVIHCRPPNNRPPTPEEVTTCKPYLLEQIRIISPKVIILLGNTALEAMLGRTGITTLRGKIIEKDGTKYIPTFHPAAVLRDMKRLTEFEADLRLAKELSEKKELKQSTL